MPNLADATAFFQPTVSQIVFLTALASANTTMVPTSAEITGGLNLMNELYDVNGFTGETTWIQRRKGGTRVRTQMAGVYSYAGSSITFTMDLAGVDAATSFAIEPDSATPLTGFLLCAWRGLTTGRPAKMFKVDVAPSQEVLSMDGSDYPRITVPFGIQKAKSIVLPTLP
jgi:hypothetical protein